MSNSVAQARRWTEFLARRLEFPAGEALIAQFEAGQIERLCDCGCNSYIFSPSADPAIPLLAHADGKYGSVFEVLFRAGADNATVEFLVFANGNGALAGLDVHYCGNAYPMPEAVVFLEPPIHVRTSPSVVA